MTATSACPVCREQFDAPLQFALHVAACTVPREDGVPAPSTVPAAVAATALATATASCPMCHMVYTSAMAAHEIEFHEEECERVNEEAGPVMPLRLNGLDGGGGGGGARPSSGAKRSRDHGDASSQGAALAGPTAKLFPAHCAVCDAGGRTLLHCAGSCARSFHPLCIEEINLARDFAANGTAAIVASTAAASTGGSTASTAAVSGGGNVSFATAITRDKKAQKAWICGECTRGLHTCTLCGFLGHEGHEIVRCSLSDCGFFFHPACLRERNLRALSPLVCPRHTCTACHAVETDMTKSSSCTKCCASIHIHCRDAAGAATALPATTLVTHTRGRGDVLDPNFHVCDAHQPPAADATSATTSAAVVTPQRRAAQYVGLKMLTRPGDLVLIVEYGNLLLPSSAKDIAPEAYNQWGIVQRVENLGDGVSSAWWTQLLTVTLFSDDSSISVANRYVLPIGSMRQYASPTIMVRDAIKWHAMGETHARYVEKQRRGTTGAAATTASTTLSQSTVLTRVILAFQERAKSLGLSSAECLANAGEGFAAWQRFSDATPRTYLETSAPVYVTLDTRGRHKPDMEIAAVGSDRTQQPTQGTHESTGDADVDMEDASSPSAQGQDSSSASSPSVSGTSKSRSATDGVPHDKVDGDVIEVMARLLEGVDAQLSRGSLLGGCTSSADDVATDSLEEVVANMVDDDDNSDVDMTDVVELPLLHEEEESEESQEYENRLSMDDLLNPLSQESLTSPDAGPSRSSSPVKSTNESGTVKDIDVRVSIQKRPLEATDVDPADVADILDENTAEERYHTAHVNKKPKLGYAMKSPIAVEFSPLPVHMKKPRGSVFSRAPLPGRPALLRRERLATEYPPPVVRNLARKVDAFFEAEEEYDGRLLKGLSSTRPAFYRPTPFLYRTAGRVGRRVDGITRVLLCQDKRNLKCFVRVSTSSKTTAVRACQYDPSRSHRLSSVSVDLVGIANFSALEKEVRCRVASAVAIKERSPGWHWQSSHGTSVTFEEELREPEIRLTYCAYDGSEHTLLAHRAHHHQQQQPDWLCFCANVVHLTATVIPQ